MHRQSLLALGSMLLLACAGAGPIYEFRPTDTPLHYAISDHGDLLIETPMGDQHSTDSTEAAIVLEIGARSGDAREVSLYFEALEIWAGGDIAVQHIEGGELIDKPFSGTLSEQGAITVTAAPELPENVRRAVDPAAMFADLLAPLPPTGGETGEPWNHTSATTARAAMSLESSYEGMARFAGDTIWNGQPARIIVSEGTTISTGRGTPAGAPGEILFTLSGTSVTRYVWDPARGIMLASRSHGEGRGELEIIDMRMTMPIAYEGGREVSLQR